MTKKQVLKLISNRFLFTNKMKWYLENFDSHIDKNNKFHSDTLSKLEQSKYCIGTEGLGKYYVYEKSKYPDSIKKFDLFEQENGNAVFDFDSVPKKYQDLIVQRLQLFFTRHAQ
jgi:hypothetical protein